MLDILSTCACYLLYFGQLAWFARTRKFARLVYLIWVKKASLNDASLSVVMSLAKS